MGATLHVSRRDHVMLLEIADPATRNALGGDKFFRSIEEAIRIANDDMDIRVVIVTGQGEAFSSGGNVREMHGRKGMFGGTPEQIAEQYRTGIQRIPMAFWKLDVPAIAAVNGAAIGAGCDLACMCDIRIASERAVFAESFVKVGIVAGDGGSWLLPRAIGHSRAAEMAFTGDTIDAATAREIGLVSRVVPHDELMTAAFELAGRIAANPPHALRWNKRLLRESQIARLDTVLEMAAAYQALAHRTEDHTEAVTALLEKRRPVFKGR
ncbi:crotonase/enoyl-CoA hydratase family protein [Rhodoplanes serenus]|jgi:2-(1,2-epoxy-1,2-dihydrophenyl)acetyl-CoA isomerase|uniref:Crotonase/enoyl-CoA hydratase family protein n=1 Tax=Rhodoplanes serenus TaxID=200615 RepID=A0A327K395_9BRAD|nr:crotonase/enoyl-CoA hydratase family protein [Rhodoplanes serenus]MTW15896.1 crotonase/enoyl-CoA hydratase family protein [Rhodoplanes serenus]RAI32185.1 enoyl-CoA hydratase [Rhodoplanes serenus]